MLASVKQLPPQALARMLPGTSHLGFAYSIEFSHFANISESSTACSKGTRSMFKVK
jgi:hypothetical protein